MTKAFLYLRTSADDRDRKAGIEVQRAACTAANVAVGSKLGAGMTMHAPWLVAARLPMTMPKQW